MVEHDLAKVGVAGSNPVSRSNKTHRMVGFVIINYERISFQRVGDNYKINAKHWVLLDSIPRQGSRSNPALIEESVCSDGAIDETEIFDFMFI